jgi:hypothetical protein
MMKPTIWLTYAWEDNEEGDVDFIDQELTAEGVTVNLDRRNLRAGERLWAQIEEHITNPELCDAWVLYATPNSLGSEACREEFAYALDRALNARGESFPVIGLFPSPIDRDLIPPGIRTRLFVSITDPDWRERIKAAAEGREPLVEPPDIPPYLCRIYDHGAGRKPRFTIEVRPRAETWEPFMVAIPFEEKDTCSFRSVQRGRRGQSISGDQHIHGPSKSRDGLMWFIQVSPGAGPEFSKLISFDNLPSRLLFGIPEGPLYLIRLTGGEGFEELSRFGNTLLISEALEQVEEVIKLDPEHADGWAARGDILDDLDRFDEAVVAFNESLSFKPDQADVFERRMLAFLNSGKYERALKDFEKVVELEPDRPYAYYYKSIVHSHLEQKSEMLDALKKAIKLDSKLREDAKTSHNFEPYRDDSEFRTIVNG